MNSRVTRFSPDALRFLRALKRHNDREWFKARKERYETLLRAPLVAMIEQLARNLQPFAPELVASPKTSLYRIYRDTRFSANKAPLKTHVAAIFPPRGLPKHEGASLYFHVSPEEVWIGGGMYAPNPPQLHAVREHICDEHRRLRAIVESPGFRRTFGRLEGERLRRVPRAFPSDHEAAEYLTFRQMLAGREYAPTFATSPRFYHTIVKVFRQAAPLAQFLNEALLARPQSSWRVEPPKTRP